MYTFKTHINELEYNKFIKKNEVQTDVWSKGHNQKIIYGRL